MTENLNGNLGDAIYNLVSYNGKSNVEENNLIEEVNDAEANHFVEESTTPLEFVVFFKYWECDEDPTDSDYVKVEPASFTGTGAEGITLYEHLCNYGFKNKYIKPVATSTDVEDNETIYLIHASNTEVEADRFSVVVDNGYEGYVMISNNDNNGDLYKITILDPKNIKPIFKIYFHDDDNVLADDVNIMVNPQE